MVRSDAARNRSRVLQAARTLVARDGGGVRMDAIAAEAGVAVGTLYRHFATKEALVAAVVEDSVDQLAEHAQRTLAAVEAGADPWAELQQLLHRVAGAYAQDRALKAAAASLGAEVHVDPGEDGSTAARAMSAVEEVLRRARDAGAVHRDVTGEDLLVVLAQVPDESATGPGSLARYLRVVLRGLDRAGEACDCRHMTDQEQAAPAGDKTCDGCGNPREATGSCEAGCPVTPAQPAPAAVTAAPTATTAAAAAAPGA